MSTSYKHQKNTKNYLVIVLSNQYWYKSFKKKSIKIIKVQLKVFKSFHAVCICKGKAAYNIPPPYLRIAKSLRAMGYEVLSNMDVYLTQIQNDTTTI